MKSRRGLALAGLAWALALGGCGSARAPAVPAAAHVPPRGGPGSVSRAAIERYLGEVEPIRDGVNQLLEGADPILGAFREQRIPPADAVRRMGRLERRFAVYTAEIGAVDPPSARLQALNTPYAHTYVLENAYLNALVAGLARDRFIHLPHTQSAQRHTIVAWREELTALARAARAPLPADLRHAGRGEIAPSPDGS